jgi:selenocysteine lyase/cysteine desulfurase
MNPNLIEPGVKYIINKTFKTSNILKEKYKNTLFNVLMFLLIIGLITFLLLYKYKGKLTEDEIKTRNNENKKYLLQKINELNYIKINNNKSKSMITDLPLLEKHPVLSIYTI